MPKGHWCTVGMRVLSQDGSIGVITNINLGQFFNSSILNNFWVSANHDACALDRRCFTLIQHDE